MGEGNDKKKTRKNMLERKKYTVRDKGKGKNWNKMKIKKMKQSKRKRNQGIEEDEKQ